ncbi:MAG: cation diffusion facilitator family transporter [Coriobacteriales bacterium]|nr:cation diffusion facilitator family transporter [Coriobacteriales bacterium]MDY5662815.1 cation diffusion facilitator family transporter [Coriobacteriales bacterium]
MYSGPSIEELRGRANEEHSVSTRKRGKIAVVAGMIGNIAVCVVKFVAAFISGSSAMLSEAIHSVVDSCDGVFMLLGLHRANRKPDYLHPFGYGKELYFWTMVVALLVFFMGGGMSLVKGVQSIQETMAGTHVLGDTTLNFIVIVAGMVIEGITLGIGIKQFNAARGDVGPVKFIRDAKDPSLYTVVLEDSAAELGLCFALVSTIVCDVTGNLYFDGVASILIGILLCFVAIILLRETKGLLVGEGMKHQSLDELRDIVEADDRVISCGRILTMYMGPEDLLIAIDATFKTELSAHEVLLTVDDLERRLHARWPQAHSVFIEAESMRSVLRQKLVEENWEDEYEDEYEDEVEEEFEEREQERLEQKLIEDEDLLKTFEKIQSDEEKAQRAAQEAPGEKGTEGAER